MGVTEQQRIFQIETMGDNLGWNRTKIAVVANRFWIAGASEPNLTKASNKSKDLNPQTAAELLTLMQRFTKMAAAVEPFKLRLDDPDYAKQLLEDFEAGKLVVQVSRREEPGALVIGVYLIENSIERNRLFQGIQNGEPRWGFPGAPIKDHAIAEAAVRVLGDLGYHSHVFSTSVRTTEEKLAKSLLDLGFVLEEKEQTNGIEID
jgi:hypothetical protein